ncbi:MAG: hypothetical protein A2452_00575 [Candidatus Firestonebacteria bacterium RIFOXYC2_FULL_39_67]|nr:MAG: hypothetical protein A2536_06125 [Candidatus Firestonebacteria bacterium RIFOXYD2_FULL_39_29]OGF56051.1 MAG: hypothetical protein A2452_00575 [Candidatus Firestonebacteria bacterium RIFOXYC2_FULL_39_67]OGF58009.1 MAG: hypothetical protein A2497_02855 [Candidatus Firestonebacteria bacterium RifOxyC12_full_39_7]
MSELDQYREIFTNESREIIGNLNKVLISLEKEPKNTDLINECFRYLHNIKGMSATMGFEKITKISHELENIMDFVRKGTHPMTLEIINALFKGIDMLDTLVNGLYKRIDGTVSLDPLINEIKECINTNSAVSENKTGLDTDKKTEVISGRDEFVKPASLRIDLKVLDELINLTGEMIISKNRLQELVSKSEDAELANSLYNTNKIMSELENTILKTRIVPAEYIFNRYPRLVRDTMRLQKKEINFIVEGSDIGLDRGILDELYDPLIHILRNCVYHGIETPEMRKACGKNQTGIIRLTAKKLENHVLIEVSDDGAGLDSEKIKKIAVQRGLLKEEELPGLTDNQAYAFLTKPGFSTVEKADSTSGRGVGLDVVKTKVEALNGIFTMTTEPKKGSKFTIKVPLTLAIIQALIVDIQGETYALPFSAVREVLSAGENVNGSIEYRGKAVPIIKLKKLLLSPENEVKPDREVIITEHHGKLFGLEINKIKTQHEIVVKPINSNLKTLKFFSGATILSDGQVALILDINTILDEGEIN